MNQEGSNPQSDTQSTDKQHATPLQAHIIALSQVLASHVLFWTQNLLDVKI